MRKLLGGLLGLVVLAVVAVLVGPSFVDWNAYKGDLADAAYKATGRTLSVDGDIGFSVLPSPTLMARDIRLANADGAASPDMVYVKSLEVRVSLSALLSGAIQVDSVNLVEPVVRLEKLADGRGNWELTPPEEKPVSQAGRKIPLTPGGNEETADPAASPDIRLDNFTVTDGALVYRDAATGAEEKIEGLNAGFSAESLNGPFVSQGRAVVRGLPVSFVVSTGTMIEGRTIPINATVKVDAGGGTLSVDGAVVDVQTAPQFKGKIAVKGDDLAAVARMAGGDVPPVLAKAFSVAGEVNATAGGATARNITLGLGDVQGAANVDVTFEGGVGAGIALRISHINLDTFLNAPRSKDILSDRKTEKSRAKASVTEKSPQGDAAAVSDAGGLPKTISASLDLTVDALTAKGASLGPVRVVAELVNGEVTISQASAQLPGSTEVSAFGFVTVPQAGPHFEGEIDSAIGDSRALARWLGVDLSVLPADRLRKVRVRSAVVANTDEATLSELKATFDGTTISGGVVARLGGRPSVGLDVTVDKISLDAYLAKPTQAAKASASGAKPPATAGKKNADTASSTSKAVGTWQALSALTTFDATVKAHVKRATYRGQTVKDTVVDATLYDGVLTLRRASVADAARAAVNVTGTIKGLGGVPTLDGVSVALTAQNPARLAAWLGQPVTPQLKTLGAVQLAARVDGTVLRPKLKATVDALGGKLGLDGVVNLLPIGSGFKGDVTVTHGDARRLLTALGGGYRPSGKLGALALTAKADAAPDAVTMKDLAIQIGSTRLAGKTTLRLAGVRPRVDVALSGDSVDVGAFLPAQRRAEGYGDPRLVPAALHLPRVSGKPGFAKVAVLAAATSSRWPTTPLDLSGLKAIDANVALQVKTLIAQGYTLDNADIQATLSDGVLTVSRLNGGLYGGTLASSMTMDGRAALRTQQSVTLKGVPLADLTRAATGAAVTTGTIDLTATLGGNGRSVADLMETLAGNGSFALTGMDIRKGAKQSALAPILDLFLGLNQLGGSLTGGKASKKANVSLTFSAKNGIFSSTDIKLTSGLGNGTATAKVDLAGWHIDSQGQVNMAQNVLTQVLSAKGKIPSRIPFRIKGPLDKPNVKIEGGATAGGVAAPVIDKLLGGKAKGLGGVLQGILGGGRTQQPTQPAPLPPRDTSGSGDGTLAPPPPSQPQQQQQAPKKIDARDLLKGLLGR